MLKRLVESKNEDKYTPTLNFNSAYFPLEFYLFSYRNERNVRGPILLCEAGATCHQGRSQWEIILHPGPKLQGLKSAASYPAQATKGIRTKSSGSHPAQSRTKAEIYCRGELVWDGWRAEKYMK